MNKEQRRNSVTRNVKEVLAELKIAFYPESNQYHDVFSDPRMDHKAVGVKVVHLELTDAQKEAVKSKMKERGFECISINDNKGLRLGGRQHGYWHGTRFNFYKKGSLYY